MAKQVLIMFGGVSAEHEVSVISGLQIVEQIDRNLYEPVVIYITKTGETLVLAGMETRKDFLRAGRKPVSFGVDETGGYVQERGITGKRYYPYAAYLAFHGGSGESGPVQGLLQACGIPFTSSDQESAVITMNKKLTKDVLGLARIATVEGISLFARDIIVDSGAAVKAVQAKLELPLIIKPAHLGSSIGISVVHTEIELEKGLLEAAHIDTEIVIEKFITGFTEYNCAVRMIDGRLEASEIEHPLSQDEILSFADKYQRGGKKTGGSGMASLQRELPAKITPELKSLIQETAKKVFVACRCKGMVRIDFMHTPEKLYVTEVNPIPGSLAYYLWEATGIQFKHQITGLIEQAVKDAQDANSKQLDYASDIVASFVNQ